MLESGGDGYFHCSTGDDGHNYSSERNEKGRIKRRFIQKYMYLWKCAVA